MLVVGYCYLLVSLVGYGNCVSGFLWYSLFLEGLASCDRNFGVSILCPLRDRYGFGIVLRAIIDDL